MKRIVGIIAVAALTISFLQVTEKRTLAQEGKEKTAYSGGIKVNLTKEDIEEAINWGAENRHSYENILSHYRFGEWKHYKERGSIDTKFRMIAWLGYKAGRLYKRPERAEIQEVLSSETFEISINTYGDKKGFADDYHIVLIQGEKVVQPVAKSYLDFTRVGFKNPSNLSELFSWVFDFFDRLILRRHRYCPLVQTKFRYSDIDPKAKTTIALVKDWGESRFEVDFSRYK